MVCDSRRSSSSFAGHIVVHRPRMRVDAFTSYSSSPSPVPPPPSSSSISIPAARATASLAAEVEEEEEEGADGFSGRKRALRWARSASRRWISASSSASTPPPPPPPSSSLVPSPSVWWVSGVRLVSASEGSSVSWMGARGEREGERVNGRAEALSFDVGGLGAMRWAGGRGWTLKADLSGVEGGGKAEGGGMPKTDLSGAGGGAAGKAEGGGKAVEGGPAGGEVKEPKALKAGAREGWVEKEENMAVAGRGGQGRVPGPVGCVKGWSHHRRGARGSPGSLHSSGCG